MDIKTFYSVEMWAFISEKLRLRSVFYGSKSMHILIYTLGKFGGITIVSKGEQV